MGQDIKVIEEGKPFSMQVRCKQVRDKFGYTYGEAVDFCGALLEIGASHIKKHKWFKYPDDHGTDYGVVCPRCGKFVMIPEEELPGYVKNRAEEIYLNK